MCRCRGLSHFKTEKQCPRNIKTIHRLCRSEKLARFQVEISDQHFLILATICYIVYVSKRVLCLHFDHCFPLSSWVITKQQELALFTNYHDVWQIWNPTKSNCVWAKNSDFTERTWLSYSEPHAVSWLSYALLLTRSADFKDVVWFTMICRTYWGQSMAEHTLIYLLYSCDNMHMPTVSILLTFPLLAWSFTSISIVWGWTRLPESHVCVRLQKELEPNRYLGFQPEWLISDLKRRPFVIIAIDDHVHVTNVCMPNDMMEYMQGRDAGKSCVSLIEIHYTNMRST